MTLRQPRRVPSRRALAAFTVLALGSLSPSPAQGVAFGRGCPGATGVPAISMTGTARPGSFFDVWLDGASPHVPASLIAGLSDSDWHGLRLPYPVGNVLPGSTCLLMVRPDSQDARVTDALGRAAVRFLLPNDPRLWNARVFLQWATLEPPMSRPTLAMSPGLDLLIGASVVTRRAIGSGTANVSGSAGSHRAAPAYGHLALVDLPQRPLVPGDRVDLAELAVTTPLDLPLGLCELKLIARTQLSVAPDLSARGLATVEVRCALRDLIAQATAQITLGGPGLDRLAIALQFAAHDPRLDPSYTLALDAVLAQDAATDREIDRLIEDLDSDDIEVRDAATFRLIRIGRRALAKMKAALAAGVTPEQEARLKWILQQVEGITLKGHEWIGPTPTAADPNPIGVHDFKFTIHVPRNGEAWTAAVHDFHLIVGTVADSGIDHGASTLDCRNLPEGWRCRYDPARGEYVFESTGISDRTPLEPCTAYEVGIRLPAMRWRGAPKDVGWYWTDAASGKVGDAGTVKGPRS